MISNKKRNLFYRVLICLLFSLIITFWASPEGDSYWSVKAGEYMVTNHTFLTGVDPFSWTGAEAGTVWMAHSWLSNVLMYLLWVVCGHNMALASQLWSFFLYFPLLFLASGAYKYNPKKPEAISTLTWFVLLTLPVFLIPYTFRAQNLGLLLYVIMLRMFLATTENENSKALWFFPVLIILWANLYGGLIWLPFVYAVTYLITSFIKINSGKVVSVQRSRLYRIKMAYAAVTSLVCGCLNPYGVQLYLYPITENTSYTKEGVQEWASASLDLLPFFILGVVIIIAMFLLTEKKYSLEELIPICSASMMTFLYVHFQGYFAIALILFLAASDARWFSQWEFRPLDRLPVLIFIAIIPVIVFVRPSTTTRLESLWLSEELTQAVKAASPQRIYNDYDIGAHLIFEGIPVFCDSRADPYSESVLTLGKSLSFVPFLPGENSIDIETAMETYHFDAFLARKGYSTDHYLREHGYNPVAEDSNYVFYVLE